MPKFTESSTVPYTAKQLYDLALDIESYPDFVPLCKRAAISNVEKMADGTAKFDSLLVFRFRKFGIYEEFESKIFADPRKTFILSTADGPPFKHFSARWQFVDIGPKEATASIEVDYEFRSKALGMFINRAAGVATSKLISAWQDRADKLYGKSSGVAA